MIKPASVQTLLTAIFIYNGIQYVLAIVQPGGSTA